MNLRKTKIVLCLGVSKNEIEDLFNKEKVATKFRGIVESKEFQVELEEIIKKIQDFGEELTKNLDKGDNCAKRIKEITSREFIEENIRLYTLLFSLDEATESIIFDGVSSEVAVSELITLHLMLLILYSLALTIVDQITSIAIKGEAMRNT